MPECLTVVGLEKPEDMDEYIRSVQGDSTTSSSYICSLCMNFTHKGRRQLRNHIESVHFPGVFKYPCNKCSRILDSKKALENHVYRNHRHPVPDQIMY